jgi:phenylalanyl-tRNA synthetase alpha subunit
MPSNNYIENSFWNFDALFEPQQHPARDGHNAFFISSKIYCLVYPYLAEVNDSDAWCHNWLKKDSGPGTDLSELSRRLFSAEYLLSNCRFRLLISFCYFL